MNALLFANSNGAGTTNAPSEAASSAEEAVKLNDPHHPSVCPMCRQPIKVLKHTIICGCGSKIKNKIKMVSKNRKALNYERFSVLLG
ncbi:hypothetical protein [Paenibacillus sp. GbtcB18]|uniref:hypothetical protein n=1 Tax=Paenibacillus sp. GbtcB18 TaxID=2824763 RepID=UPI001C2FEB88|nr:hypothetical protein [Paenibacillus sp. GbtcB18]